ncbi:MAG: spore photoproduct lyase family protein [Eubacteriales bacterium]
MLNPKKVYYEPAVMDYELGRILHSKYADIPWEPIQNHNSIPFLQNNPNSEFMHMKKFIVVGVRKTQVFVPNQKTSDFLVPYTSSGCSAACMYCYLVCNYNKCSYLRLFVNRERLLSKIIRTAEKSDDDLVFEIGSNSDLVLENTITGNLVWTIEHFAHCKKGFLTLPTKFDMVDSLLPLRHQGRIIMRMSVNPEEIIRKIEIGTSPLPARIQALNQLSAAGYQIGLLIAPIILIPQWRELYPQLIEQLAESLSARVKKGLKIEIIFMTYSYVHRMINRDAFLSSPELYDPEIMTVRGRGRYCYRTAERQEASDLLRENIAKFLPKAQIQYIV